MHCVSPRPGIIPGFNFTLNEMVNGFMWHTRMIVAIGLVILANPALYAQKAEGFDLFDPNRGREEPPPPPPKPTPPPPKPTPPPPKRPMPPQKDFTLQGVSMIGRHQSVMLRGPNGKTVPVRPRQSGPKPMPIPGYGGYALLSVSPREVRIQYPEVSPCRKSDKNRGIQCSPDGKFATLSLAHANPLPPKPTPPPQPPGNNPQAVDLAKRLQELQRQKQNQNQNNPQKFQPRRIRDEDVPPGMKVVRTPFGDRLVPDNQPRN